jgi:hypothetical protein
MNKIIVIGMDNTGKTTLCEYLSYKIPLCDWVKSPGPVSREDQLEYVLTSLKSKRNVVMERFPIFDEYVYGVVLRGKTNFTRHDSSWEFVRTFDPLIIYCRPSDAIITDFGKREQYEGVKENSWELLKMWDRTVKDLGGYGFRIFKYNWGNPDHAIFLDAIIDSIKGE